ncbi:protein translocase subunit SecF [Propionicicella superfundia]|uniref:protein translocase subunit SecF n=1 Tax=Propionicicella superfundia TaxID=348582 RepID=UPI0009FF604A
MEPVTQERSATASPAGAKAEEQRKTSLAHKLYTGALSYDFIGHRRLWYSVSAVVLLICVVAFAVRGLNLSIEFRGGAEFTVATQATDEAVAKVQDAVIGLDLPDMADVPVQKIGDGSIRVQTRSLEVDEISQVKTAIGDAVGVDGNEVAYSLVGASWGQQITNQGIIALVVFLALVSLLIWIYFREAKMAISALVALVHDLVVTIGVFAIAGFAFTPASLIGMLTILGYSLYDTVVVFDKVRENTADLKNTNRTYSEAANNAVNQVLVRSVNTTIIGVLPVAALLVTGVFVLGTGPLKDVGLVLFVGMLAGAYSSIFIATPLLAQLKEREPEMVAQRNRVRRRADREAARVAVTMTTTEAIASPTAVPVRDKRGPAKKG